MRKIILLLSITLLLVSCKEEKQQKTETIYSTSIDVLQKEVPPKNTQTKVEHQSQETVSNFTPDKNRDDSQYNDLKTLEFSLKDDKGRNLCLYHNIWKQPNIDFENHEVFKDWSTETKISKWIKQELDGLSVIWNYMNGAILIMETESSNWSTKRGIKVGDSISKAYEIYAPDADIYELDEEKRGFIKIKDNENNLYILKQYDERIYIYIANLIDEEIMNIKLHHNDGIITKIEVYFSN